MVRRCLVLGPVLLAATAFRAEAVEPRPLPRASVQQFAQPDGRSCIGVLGAVGRPGVYEMSTANPALAEVIGRAGGLAPDATGNVRIIRNGKPGQQAFFLTMKGLELFPGDVICVDGPMPRAKADEADGAPVMVAFVNLIERPVVINLGADFASVDKLMSLLKQSPETARTVRVIPPARMRSRSQPGSADTLASGTVLVFEPAALDVASLPAALMDSLPPVVPAEHGVMTADAATRGGPAVRMTGSDNDAPTPALPGDRLQGPDSAPVAAPGDAGPRFGSGGSAIQIGPRDNNNGGTFRKIPPVRSVDPRSRIAVTPEHVGPSSPMELLPPAPSDARDVVDMLPPSAAPGPALQFNGANAEPIVVGESEPIDRGAIGEPRIPRFPIGLPKPTNAIAARDVDDPASRAAAAISLMPKKTAPPESVGATLASMSTEAESTNTNLEIASAWGLFGILAVIAAWVVSRKSQPIPAEQTVAKAAAVKSASPLRSRLDELIANEIPIDVERVRMPGQVEFFGRARSKPYLRFDEAHGSEILKPHIGAAPERAAEPAAADAAMASPEIEVSAEGRRVDVAHGEPRGPATAAAGRRASDRKGDLLERALATVHDANARHVGGPHIGAVKSSETVSAEGATQT